MAVATATDAPAPTAPPRPPLLWGRFSARHVAVAGAALLAALLNLLALHQADATQAVTVAARALVAGERIGPGDFAVARVAADGPALSGLLVAGDAPARHGWIVTRSVRPGELVRRDDLRAAAGGGGRRAMSLPIEPEHAVAGALEPGDVVDVIEVRDGVAAYVLAGVRVLAVGGGRDARSGLATGPHTVTLEVDDTQALWLALALREAAVELVRATGASPLSLRAVGGAADPAAAEGSGDA